MGGISARTDDRSRRAPVREATTPRPDGAAAPVRPGIAAAVAGLQATAGNRVVQARLTVGRSSDPAEAAADRFADAVYGRGAGGHHGPAIADPLGGATVDAATTRGIASMRGGGIGLDPGVRRDLEPHLGRDLSGMRIHTGGRADALARRLDATAFASGQDLFFSHGAYQPGSTAGKHLLAHEAAHTVQDGSAIGRTQAPVRRFFGRGRRRNRAQTPPPSQPPSTATTGLIKTAGGATLYKLPSGQTPTLTPTGVTVPQFTQCALTDKTPDQKLPGSTVLNAFLVTYEGQVGIIDATHIEVGGKRSTDDGESHRGDDAGDVFGEPSGGLGDAADHLSDLTDESEKSKWEGTANNYSMAGASLGLVADIIAIGNAFAGWKEKSAGDKVDSVFDAMNSGASLMSNATSIKSTKDAMAASKAPEGAGKKALEATAKKSEKIAGGFGAGADIMSAIVEIKNLFKQFHKIHKARKKQLSRKEITDEFVGAAQSAVSATKAIVDAASKIYKVVHDKVPGGLANAAPGLDIALGAIDLMVHGHGLYKSFTLYRGMLAQKRGLKGTGSRLGGLNQKWFQDQPLTHKTMVTLKARIEQRIQAIDSLTTPTEEERAERADLVLALKDEEDYSVSRAFERTNVKTVRRAVFNLTVDLVKMAGAIGTVSGIGAVGGQALKLAAGGMGLLRSGARLVKQGGRDLAAKVGPNNVLGKIFNAKKSTDAKKTARDRVANQIIDRLIAIAKAGPGSEVATSETPKVQGWIRAAGLSWKSWSKLAKTKPSKAYEKLVQGQATRG